MKYKNISFSCITFFLLYFLVISCGKDNNPIALDEEQPVEINVEISSWEQTNGPFSGNIRSFLVNKNDEIFIATFQDGIYKSSDNGNNWLKLVNGLDNAEIAEIAVSSDGFLWAVKSEGGVLKSTDNGNSWSQTSLSWGIGSSIAIDTLDNILVGGGNQVYRSRDDGESWTEILKGKSQSEVNDLAINNEGHIFVATNNEGVFRSLDMGANWAPINQGLSNLTVFSLAINSEGIIFAGTNGKGVFRSSDNGNTWNQVNNGLTNGEGFTIAFDADENIFVGAFGGVFRSTDKGDHWQRIDPGFNDTLIRTVSFNSSNHIFVGTEYYGVFRSIDQGISWQQINSGIINSTVNAIAINSDNSLFAGTVDGVFRSDDDGKQWQRMYFPGTGDNDLMEFSLDPYIYDFVMNPSTGSMFVATRKGVFRSNTGGGSWIFVISDVFETLAINSDFQIFGGSPGAGIFRTSNNGNTWESINAGLSNTFISAIGISNNNKIFAGTNGGLFVSTDNGSSWKYADLMVKSVRDIVINSKGDIFVADAGAGVYYSSDDGMSWKPRSDDISYIESLLVDSSGVLYAGTLNGIFISGNNGKSWQSANSALANTRIYSLALDSHDNLYAGTDGSGIFRSKVNRIQTQRLWQ